MKSDSTPRRGIKALAEKILARYEDTRKLCLQYGGWHPEASVVCHQAIAKARCLDGLARKLALELDDQSLAVKQLATALLRVLEDAESLAEALKEEHMYTKDPACSECKIIAAHEKLFKELSE